MSDFMIDEDGVITAPFVRSAYNYDRNAASDASSVVCVEPSLTQQQFKEETDINTIVERFGLTGEVPSNVRMPLEGDFTEVVTDYQSALNMVKAADEAFMQMPAMVRREFDNDPQKFMEFVDNPANRDKAKALGLLTPEVEIPKPIEVRVIPDPAAPIVPPKTSST